MSTIFTSSPGLGYERASRLLTTSRNSVNDTAGSPRPGGGEQRSSSRCSGRARACEGSRNNSRRLKAAALALSSDGAAVDDDDAAARRADPHHLAQHRERVEEMVKREPRGDDREAAVGIGQRRHVALVPGECWSAPFPPPPCARGRASPGSRRSRSRGGHAAQRRRPPARRRRPRRARCRPGPGSPASTIFCKRVFIGDRRRGVEHRGLAGELIADQRVVRGVAHSWLSSRRPADLGQHDTPIAGQGDQIVAQRVFPGAIERTGAAPRRARLGHAARPRSPPSRRNCTVRSFASLAISAPPLCALGESGSAQSMSSGDRAAREPRPPPG